MTANVGKKVWFLFNRKRKERGKSVLAGKWPEEGLYGFYSLREKGFNTRFSDKGHKVGFFSKGLKIVENLLSEGGNKIGFNLAQAFKLRRELSDSDLIFATADSSALGVLALKSMGLVSKPIVYSTIGLTHSFSDMKSQRARLYRRLLAHCDKIIYYGHGEGELLRNIYNIPSKKMEFIPFGVQTDYFISEEEGKNPPLSIGIDHLRDWPLLFLAAKQVDFEIELVCNRDVLCGKKIPENIILHDLIPMEKLKAKMAKAEFVILPVKENPYTGATITLLQSMASGRPVVISKTEAIKEGYHLKNEKNCLFVKPGDLGELVRGITRMKKEKAFRKQMGKNARKTVVNELDIKFYTKSVAKIFQELIS